MTVNAGTQLVGKIHGKVVHERRIVVLAKSLASFLPPGARLLDVGCGDGRLGALIRDAVPSLQVEGVEVLARSGCAIPCRAFDGSHLPFPDGSFDACLFVDVLHHTTDPFALLQDACRVSRKFVLIKDHFAETTLDHWTLRFMDWVSNRPHGVTLPYAYLSASKWKELYGRLGLNVERTQTKVPLYPAPFSAVFGRNLHFISLLGKS
jgi:ubiquinone/menaquinone biosynthesis C-methylase UbiE